jgi:hypothetical protein
MVRSLEFVRGFLHRNWMIGYIDGTLPCATMNELLEYDTHNIRSNPIWANGHWGGEAGFRTTRPMNELEDPLVVGVAEEFGHALRAVRWARVNHSEPVDLTERDSDSRMEQLCPIPPD